MKSVFRGSAYIFRGVNWNIKPATSKRVVKRQLEILERLMQSQGHVFQQPKEKRYSLYLPLARLYFLRVES